LKEVRQRKTHTAQFEREEKEEEMQIYPYLMVLNQFALSHCSEAQICLDLR